MYRIKACLIFLMCFCAVTLGRAQFDTQSPYSYYGIGSPAGNSIQNGSSMGGVSQGLRDSVYVNTMNPASYSSIDVTQLTFGFEFNSLTHIDKGISSSNRNLFINQFGLGIPIMHRHRFVNWGMYLGFSPYTQVGYRLADSTNIVIGQDTLMATYNYNGTGGLNKITFGNGFQLGRNFSIGANLHYVFGTSERSRATSLPANSGYLSARVVEKTSVNNFMLDVGAQGYFHFPVKRYITPKIYSFTARNNKGDTVRVDSIVPNDKRAYRIKNYQVVIGSTYTLGRTFNAGFDELGIQYLPLPGQDFGVDTFLLSSSNNQSITLPHGIAAGISIANPGIWTLAADINYQTWSDFRYFDQPTLVYHNSISAHLGTEYTPYFSDKLTGKQRFFKNIAYRVGARYFSRYYRPDGKPVDELAFTMGFGLPFGFNKTYDEESGFKTIISFINLGFEGGFANSRGGGVVNESFFRLSLSLTLRDKWFIKRKYN